SCYSNMPITNSTTYNVQHIKFSTQNTERLMDRPKVLRRRKTPYVWKDKLNPVFDDNDIDNDDERQSISTTSSDNDKNRVENFVNMDEKNLEKDKKMGKRSENFNEKSDNV
ncbi:2952_t:CDS:1, partial [Scutellospora calospora]